MANDKSSKNVSSTSTQETASNGGLAGAAPKALTAEDKKSIKLLFEAADKAEKAVSDARLALENSIKARSVTVKAIVEKCGGSKGPFAYNGEQVTIVCRKSKSNGTENWFFKGKGDKEVMDIG